MLEIDPGIINRLDLNSIEKVTFYKRDQIVTDLICCDICIGGRTLAFHEELPGWPLLLNHLEKLPNFNKDWFQEVSQPPFEACEFVSYRKQ